MAINANYFNLDIMKNTHLKIFLFTTLFFCFSLQLLAVEVPPLKRRVTDLAGMLSVREQQRLEEKLYLFEKQTSNQIGVLLISTLGEETIESYAMQVAEKWQLGQKEKDNGILLLISQQDRLMRIEVGYGLEGALPDMIADQIIRYEIAPEFRKGNYFQGIAAGLDAIIQATKNEYEADPSQYRRSKRETTTSFGSLLVPIIFFILFMGAGRRGRRGLLWAIIGASMFRGGGHRGGGFGSFGGGGFSGGGGGFGGGGASGGW